MTNSRQFIACKFRPNDKREFTYHNDGPPVAVGDQVKVPDRSGDGWNAVTVSAVGVPEPTKFATKAILGKVEGVDYDARILDAAEKPKPATNGDLFA